MINKRRLLRAIRLLLFALLIAVVGAHLAIAYTIANRLAHPGRVSAAGATPSVVYENVSFPGDGLTLSGWYVPSKNRAAIIFSHGLASNRAALLNQALVLAQQGYGVLLYDLRAHGDSGGKASSVGAWLEANDIDAAVTYLQTRTDVDPDRIGAFGFSVGARATILAASRSGKIKAIVADGSVAGVTWNVTPALDATEIASFPLNWLIGKFLEFQTGTAQSPYPADVIGQIAPRPVLLITTSSELRENQRLYAAAREPKSLWVIPEATHGGGFAARPQEYSDKLITFFNAALLQIQM